MSYAAKVRYSIVVPGILVEKDNFYGCQIEAANMEEAIEKTIEGLKETIRKDYSSEYHILYDIDQISIKRGATLL